MRRTSANLILIGLRGSGKTTLGRLLAERTRREFVDLDAMTPRLLGAPNVSAAWTRHGEAAFRRAELRALIDVLARDSSVLALGGGTPAAAGAADLLLAERRSGRARVVYLYADAETLRSRLRDADNSDRPSLTGADPLSEIDAVLARRDPLYRDLADDVLETGGMTVAQAVEALAAMVSNPD
jgi:shikimate kinase